ncbi:class I SAM-dependent methyltransferase [Mumia sp. ZJ1417]|uniref:class I SAM-dependent methyltransferase n=1 Tax=unclassified Mumia TaxID=2621872 RepID=UPI00141F5EDF|nr:MULTISPECIES: class I SAM-dependent methyltransferase [unclassified Mumia]QMW67185.1 class I SAM-dependent methyltransferase [Mumia sp. ZJ1417]
MDSSDWDRRYAEQPRPFGAVPNATLVAELVALSPGRAVDLACGDGRHAAWLATRGWQVEAIDFSPVAIADAEREWDATGDTVRWLVGDALTWEPKERVDLVLIAYLQTDQLPLVLERARTWLRPAGRVVYLGHARDNLAYGVGGPRSPEVLPTVASLATALDGMEMLSLRHVVRATPAGDAYDVLAVARELPA